MGHCRAPSLHISLSPRAARAPRETHHPAHPRCRGHSRCASPRVLRKCRVALMPPRRGNIRVSLPRANPGAHAPRGSFRRGCVYAQVIYAGFLRGIALSTRRAAAIFYLRNVRAWRFLLCRLEVSR